MQVIEVMISAQDQLVIEREAAAGRARPELFVVFRQAMP